METLFLVLFFTLFYSVCLLIGLKIVEYEFHIKVALTIIGAFVNYVIHGCVNTSWVEWEYNNNTYYVRFNSLFN